MMTNHPSLAQQKGYYRYSTSDLDQKGAARLFPYTGEDGAVRYVLTKLYQKLLAEGKLSAPWILLLTELQ
jgi:arachidonate 15-lipoxygenase